jgi:hypothetical protein
VTMGSSQFMKMSGARHRRTWSHRPGPWNAFATMEWQACSQAGMTLRSSSTHSAFLVLLGAARGTFIARYCIRFINSSSRR